MTAALTPVLTGPVPAHSASAAPFSAPAIEMPASAKKSGDPLVIDEITPDALGKKSKVTVTGRVTNTTGGDLKGLSVRMRYSSYPLAGRSQVKAHADGDRNTPQATGPEVEVPGTLAPGESAEYRVKADVKDLGFSSYGVYPMSIEAVRSSGKRFGIKNTFLPYDDGEKVKPVKVAWVWPLMDQPQRAGDNTFLGNTLDEEVGPEGRLGRLLSIGGQTGDLALRPPSPTAEPTPSPSASASSSSKASEDADGTDGAEDEAEAQPSARPRVSGRERKKSGNVPITWAVDPGLLDDIQRLSSGGYRVLENPKAVPADRETRTKAYEASTNAEQWLQQARAIIGDDPLIATPYADPDIPALLRNDLKGDAEAAVELGRQSVRDTLERTADPSVAWPSDGTMDAATKDFLTEQGADRFLLGDSALPAQRWLGHTPTAQAALPAADDSGEGASAVVADGRLTSVLGQSSWGPGEAALAHQRFAAETQMITAEEPGTERTVVLTPPRDWNPSPELADELLNATESLPWITPVALDDVKADAKDTKQRRGLDYPGGARRAELSGGYLDRVEKVRTDVRVFNSVLTDDADPFRPAVLRMESAAWRDDPSMADRVRTLVADSVSDTKGKVRIMPGEPYRLLSQSGTLPIVVANDLAGHPVRVSLSIRSENAERLKVAKDYESKPVQIDAGRKTTAYVPIEARVNGRTVLHMQLLNDDGEPVNVHEVTTPVTTSESGTTALYITIGAAAVLFVVLLPRVLRKWGRLRRGPRAAVIPAGTSDADDLPDLGDNGTAPAAAESATRAADAPGGSGGGSMQDNGSDAGAAPGTPSAGDTPEPAPEDGSRTDTTRD